MTRVLVAHESEQIRRATERVLREAGFDTIGVKENVRYQNVPHSSQMRITERIRLVQPDVLQDEITVDDPVTLEKPWTFTFTYRRMPDYTLLEYICEDNREYIDEKGLQRMRLGSPERR